jgi:hypothetical protein
MIPLDFIVLIIIGVVILNGCKKIFIPFMIFSMVLASLAPLYILPVFTKSKTNISIEAIEHRLDGTIYVYNSEAGRDGFKLPSKFTFASDNEIKDNAVIIKHTYVNRFGKVESISHYAIEK